VFDGMTVGVSFALTSLPRAHLRSISPTIYCKLLRLHFQKAEKNAVKPSVFFALLESLRLKAAHKMLLKLTPAVHFHQL
jgi:hypothetical protein